MNRADRWRFDTPRAYRDGHFVPSITWGSPVIASLRKRVPDAFFDCHMMVTKPSQWVPDIAKAGGQRYTFHLEVNTIMPHDHVTHAAPELLLFCWQAVDTDDLDLAGLCTLIRKSGMQVGIAVKPGTGVEALSAVIALVDMVLVMTVEPGFGGQSFMPGMMPKVLSLRSQYPKLDIQVDGGLSPKTIDAAAAAGANMIVAGVQRASARAVTEDSPPRLTQLGPRTR